MLRAAPLFVALPLLFTACGEVDGTPVRATLSDGQVLVGEVQTGYLTLEGGLGTLQIPLEDVGEVFPVEGGDLAGSSGQVSVWLRNGTELVGTWADPELTMGIEIGGSIASVPTPTEQLYRFQLQGEPDWPEGDVYRVRTDWGDDFLIDPENTRLNIDSDLGTFAPFLSECASASPLGDPSGDWRIELYTGTVLIGPLSDAELTFALPEGPEQITVPLAHFTGLDVQHWGGTSSGYFGYRGASPVTVDQTMAAEEVDAWSGEGAGAAPAARPAPRRKFGEVTEADGWFSNSGLLMERESQYAQ